MVDRIINCLYRIGAFIAFLLITPFGIVCCIIENIAETINKNNYYTGHNKIIFCLLYIDATIAIAWITTLDDATNGFVYTVVPEKIDYLKAHKKDVIARMKRK